MYAPGLSPMGAAAPNQRALDGRMVAPIIGLEKEGIPHETLR